MKHFKLSFFSAVAAILFMAVPVQASAADKKTEVPDSVLFNMGMRLYDSLTTESFPKMYKEALRKSKEAGSEWYYITMERMLISRYDALHDVDGFLAESDKVIKECQQSNTSTAESLLYATWEHKADRLDSWGMKDDAIKTAKEMSEYAAAHQHEKGLAMAQFIYGGFYLNDHQLEEAESCLLKSWNICKDLDYKNLMTRVGFSRIAVLLDQDKYEEALALTDSVSTIISESAANGQRIGPVTRLQLARQYCSAYSRLGDHKNAEAQLDTLMKWYEVDPDPSQTMSVLHTDATVKFFAGRYKEAIPVLDSIVRLAERRNNWAEIADNTYSIAFCQLNLGQKDEAIQSFKDYAAAKDSAIVQDSRAQLDELTKKYELAEISLAAKKAQNRAEMAIAVVVLLLVVVGFYTRYTKRLLEKNKALYEKVKQSDKKTVEVARLAVLEKDSPQARIFKTVTDLMKDKKLYRDTELNRDSLATAVGTNSKYLADAVREFGDGRTVNELINWWRLQEASEILGEDADVPVAIVAEEVGFGSSQTFSRLFKEHYGMTPTDFRAMALKAVN